MYQPTRVTPEQLRALADLLEQHPDLPRPRSIGRSVDSADDLDLVVRVLTAAGVEHTDWRLGDHHRQVKAPGLMHWSHVSDEAMAKVYAADSYVGAVQP